MRVYIAFFLFFFISVNTYCQKIPLDTLRYKYKLAVNNQKLTEELYSLLKKGSHKNPVVLAYRGGVEALRAKHSSNVYKKINYLKKSQKTLTSAVNSAPNDIEIRFIRYAIEANLPDMLGMSPHVNEDRSMIVKNFHTVRQKNYPVGLVQEIKNYLINSGKLTSEEEAELKKY